VQAGQLLASAGWARSLTTGRWTIDGRPAQLVVGAAAERAEDVRVAQQVADQLDAAGIDAGVVAPSGVELFGLATVPAVPPSTTAPNTTGATSSSPNPGGATADTSPNTAVTPGAATTTPITTTVTATTGLPPPPGGVEVDLIVLPRSVGGDRGTELASDFGCAVPTPAVAVPARTPTGFCSPALQPLLDELVSADPRPDAAAAVERSLWTQVPALPLFQPVTLVVSTAASDGLTGIGPGPLATGPVTGAERWRPPPS